MVWTRRLCSFSWFHNRLSFFSCVLESSLRNNCSSGNINVSRNNFVICRSRTRNVFNLSRSCTYRSNLPCKRYFVALFVPYEIYTGRIVWRPWRWLGVFLLCWSSDGGSRRIPFVRNASLITHFQMVAVLIRSGYYLTTTKIYSFWVTDSYSRLSP